MTRRFLCITWQFYLTICPLPEQRHLCHKCTQSLCVVLFKKCCFFNRVCVCVCVCVCEWWQSTSDFYCHCCNLFVMSIPFCLATSEDSHREIWQRGKVSQDQSVTCCVSWNWRPRKAGIKITQRMHRLVCRMQGQNLLLRDLHMDTSV